MRLPDRMTAVVRSKHRQGDLSISGFHPVQPAEPDVIHAGVQGGRVGTPLHGTLRFELRNGEWHEAGPAPSLRDASWHPDLDDGQGLLIELARRVLHDLNRGSSIQFWPMSKGNTSSGYDIVWSTMFNLHAVGDVDRPAGIADEQELDMIPHVRTVERVNVGFEELFGIKLYDDESGVDCQFSLKVTKNGMLLTYSDEEGAQIELESISRDGTWRHETRLVTPSPGDPIAMLRMTAEPGLALERLLEEYDVDQTDAPVGILTERQEPAQNRWRTMLSDSIRAESVIERGEDIVIMIAPGTTFSQNI
jgi:hypothetical protein